MEARSRVAALRQLFGRPPVQDALVATAVAGMSLFALWNPPLFVDFDFRPPDAPGIVLALLGGAAVAVRSRWPMAATAVALAAVVPMTQLGYSQSIGGMATLLTLYSVAVSRRLRSSASMLGLVVGFVGLALATSPIDPTLSDWVANLFVIATAWAFGRSVRVRRTHHAAVAERNRAQADALAAETRAMLVEERTRVALEMQDLVAHTLTEVNVQVAAARRTLTTGDRRCAEQLLQSAESAGRSAMEEIRRAADLLGHGKAGSSMRPQPGLADLHDLVERERAAGVEVSFTSAAGETAVPPGIALTAYRVVEEAFAEGHVEGIGAAAVHVEQASQRVALQVRTSPQRSGIRWHGEASPTTGPLERLRTRVELYGGELTVARTSDGETVVSAAFPVVTERTA